MLGRHNPTFGKSSRTHQFLWFKTTIISDFPWPSGVIISMAPFVDVPSDAIFFDANLPKKSHKIWLN
jgi:hypothetical protein